MINIWLDDERDPNDPIIIKLFGTKDNWTWVKTIEEALDIITTNKINMISLDHDLGYEKTGYDLITKIEELTFTGNLYPFYILIHSQNPVGIQRMKTVAKRIREYWNDQ